MSFLTDAIDCLGLRKHLGKADIADHATAYFPSLKWIALTSQEFLRPGQDRESTRAAISSLIQDAAAAATKMPRLEGMELWNWEYEPRGSDGRCRGCVFRYEAGPTLCDSTGKPSLTWRTSWGDEQQVEIDERAVETWGAVVRGRPMYRPSREPLSVVDWPLPEGEYRTYVDVIAEMKMPECILNQRSTIPMTFDERVY